MDTKLLLTFHFDLNNNTRSDQWFRIHLRHARKKQTTLSNLIDSNLQVVTLLRDRRVVGDGIKRKRNPRDLVMNSRGEPRNPCNSFSSYLSFVEIATRRLYARRPLGVFLFCFLLRLPLLLSLRHTRYPFERVLPVFTGNRAAVKRSTTRAHLWEGRSSRIAGRRKTDKGKRGREKERERERAEKDGWTRLDKGERKEEGGREEGKKKPVDRRAGYRGYR